MKRWMTAAALVWTLLLSVPAAAAPVTIDVTGGDVRAVLLAVARMANIPLIVDDGVAGAVTAHLTGEGEEVLRLVAAARGIHIERHGSVFLALSADARTENRRVHVYTVRYADPEELAHAANLSLTGEGKRAIVSKNNEERWNEGSDSDTQRRVLVDRATNTLLFYGTESEALSVREIISALDVAPRQVSLEARVIAISKQAAKELGVDWSWSALPQYPRVRRGDDGAWEVGGRNAGNEGTSAPGIIRFGRGPEGVPFEFYYSAAIRALITDGRAKMLARPNITTVQGHEALINIGAEVPVPRTTTSNTVTTTGIDYREAGIILRYTPRVTADGNIVARVHTEVSTPVFVEDLKAYRFQKRSADTTVRLKNGETMVIGGLIDSDESRSLSKIPFLGDIPILGAFFRSVRTSKTETELMIFLTAHVLDEE
ncbi:MULTISPECIES: secretin N-terminal domain-containing protein [Selenomonas]|uniref:Pilus assembly protein PilQ n=1 Tax=Selenomonas timonae TaxID=2754044 RepID=A0A7G7VK28_9FIRM|nr:MULTISPECIES: secretin N-terminal domain-containing protein [Selenomonas]EKY01338.1 type IV pilus secretin PilQ [Selenomonas sp. oral taxon 138 str. F0429]QNH54471.1 pilus assembly protein PilQ [Selenomonas timonae]